MAIRISRPGQGNQPPSFAMLNTPPRPDVAPYHNRQVVVLRPEDWAAWIQLTKTETELLRPPPEGTLDVTTVREGAQERNQLYEFESLKRNDECMSLGASPRDLQSRSFIRPSPVRSKIVVR